MLSWDLHAKQTRTLERVSLGSSFKITWLQPGTDECTSHWGTLRNIAHCLSVCLATLQSQDSQNSAHNLPPCEHSQMELSLLQFPGEQSWWWWVENNDWRWLGTTANSVDLYGTKRGCCMTTRVIWVSWGGGQQARCVWGTIVTLAHNVETDSES